MNLAILQARLSSTRFPGKVLEPILGKAMLELQIERIQQSTCIDHLIVATSSHGSDDPIDDFCKRMKIECYRGSLENVLDRFYQAAQKYNPQHVVRLTGDCPLIDPIIIDMVCLQHLRADNDYTATKGFPDGLDTEIMKYSALTQAWEKATKSAETEHVTYYIYSHPEIFKIGSCWNSKDLSALRWTVDYPADFQVVTEVFKVFYPKSKSFGYHEILDYLTKHPEITIKNQHILNNEGLARSIAEDAKNQNT